MVEHNETMPACPLCESSAAGPHTDYQHIGPGNWSLFQCAHCKTAFLHPCPDEKMLANYYDRTYYGRGGGKFLSPIEILVRAFRYRRAKTVKKHASVGRILDVGCGRGLMLSHLKKWGYTVDGVELDTLAAKRAEKSIGHPVYHRLEEVYQESRAPCQAITFWHSLEHMPEPGKSLRMAYDLLAHGGILVIAAPNMASIQSRLAKTHWLHLDLPRHLAQFDMGQLARFLESKGFTLLCHNHFSQEYNVIDTLCHLYGVLGFDPLFPFNMIRNTGRKNQRTWTGVCHRVLGLSLMVPLTGLAFFLANLFSVFRSGSTTTLLLQKR